MQTPRPMTETTRLVTAEELEKRPDDDWRYELVDGRVIRMSPVGGVHAVITAGFLVRLTQHVKPGRLGIVVTELGFKLTIDPDTVRAPDVAFIRRERLPATGLPRGFWRGAPDLAVEVLSPEDRPAVVLAKIEEYLMWGTHVVLVLDPDEQTVTANRPGTPPITVRGDEAIDLDDVLPGFRCSAQEIFE
jgi:Uma2 family endonuclease